MSRFVFRLAPVLRVREAARDECRAALAEAYRVDDVLRRQWDAIQAEWVELVNLCRRVAGPGTVDVDRLVESQRYELSLKSRQVAVGRQRDVVAAEIDRRRQSLVEADREVRVLEKLRERQAEQYRAQEERREVQRLDEVAQQQAVREVAT